MRGRRAARALGSRFLAREVPSVSRRPLIVGSGIAGLYVALRARQVGLAPTIVTKSRLEESNTRYAQGGIAAALGPDDSVALHLEDTVRAGDGLVDLAAARCLTAEAPARIADLVRFGVPFDTVDGQIALGREAAHSRFRILHAGGDATGLRIEETLRARVVEAGIEARERRVLRALRAYPAGVSAVLSAPDGSRLEEVDAGAVVLATGGAGSLFRESSNPSIATGEGVALAFRAGARLSDMEFIQFHPTVFYRPGAPRHLITEAVRGEGAVLRNEEGERFLVAQHPAAELAPRDFVSRAIRAELDRSGASCVYLDATGIPADRFVARFPSICRFLAEYHLDPTREPIPVAPAAHYMIGGVTTDLTGRTNLPGLLACGEVASTGVHGANRLASNSLLEGLVFGERVVRELRAPSGSPIPVPRPRRLVRGIRGEGHGSDRRATERVRDLLWDKVGIVRDRAGLAAAVRELQELRARSEPSEPSEIPGPTANHALLGLLMATAALSRTESRGTHFRSDFPKPRADWRVHLSMVASVGRPGRGAR